MCKNEEILLTDIHPSQFYISQKKISEIEKWFNPQNLSNFEPIPIKKLNGKIIFTDGHTRAWMAYKSGIKKVPIVWDEDELDWDFYQFCVEGCLEREIYSIKDFEKRILSEENYIQKWDKWCENILSGGSYAKELQR